MIKIGKYNYELSTRRDKKLMTVVAGRTLHFGAAGMEHYHDKTGLLPKSLNHRDERRRRRYLDRSANIKNKEGKLTLLLSPMPNIFFLGLYIQVTSAFFIYLKKCKTDITPTVPVPITAIFI